MNTRYAILLVITLATGTLLAVPPACEDRDRDGYLSTLGCGGEVDCNDDDRYAFPGAPEICDGVDNNCNGQLDDHPTCPILCTNPEVIPPLRNVSQQLVRSRGATVAWARNAWVVGFDSYSAALGAGCNDLWLTKLARDGTTIIPPTRIVAASASDFTQPQDISLAWTGSSIAAAWVQAVGSDCGGSSNSDVKFRRFDSLLQPVSATVSFVGCPPSNYVANHHLAWGRSSYALGWGESNVPMRFTMISRDDQVLDSCGTPVTDDVNANDLEIRWNGDQFGAAWTEGPPDVNYTTIFGELYFRRVGEDGSLLDPEPTRVTYNPARTERSTLVWADGEWGSAWSDTRTNSFNLYEIFMTRMYPSGTAVTPPGDVRVSCCNSGSEGSPRHTNRLLWTGGEYGVVYDDLSLPPYKTQGDILFQRVDRQGVLIGPPLLVSNDTQKHASVPDAAWNGREFGIVWGDYRASDPAIQVYFARVGCGCTDADADGFSSCTGRDCVDSNPLVNPLRPEVCTSGFDDNCDGKLDCQDTVLCATGPGAAPAEVQSVRFDADKVTLRWNPAANATSYDVLTEDLTYLLQDTNFSAATCAAWRHPTTSLTVNSTPPRGRALMYLVRGKADTCRLGTWGTALRDTARLTCP